MTTNGSQKRRNVRRTRRQMRVRRGLFGTGERPRLAVYRSSKQIYAQAIDDQTGQTLAAASSLDKEFKESLTGTKTDVAK